MMEILKACVNAKYKIGTTGTLPTEKSELLQIKAVLGEVLFEIRSRISSIEAFLQSCRLLTSF